MIETQEIARVKANGDKHEANCKKLTRDGYERTPVDMVVPCDGYDFVSVGPTLFMRENKRRHYDF